MTRQEIIEVGGMTCASCVSHVEKTLLKQPHVTQALVNLATERARITLDADTDPQQLVQAIKKAGYDARLVITNTSATTPTASAKHWTAFFGPEFWLIISALLSLPLILPMLGGPALPPVIQLLLASLVQFGPGWRFYSGAWQALKNRNGNMDLLVALGTSTAWLLSLWLMLAHPGHAHLYFEASAMVITLVRLGKYLEQRARQQASAAIRSLHALQPETATLVQDDQQLTVSISTLHPGEIVQVAAGERIPVDGMIVEGRSSVDESMLTGEPVPVARGIDETVRAGTINLDGRLRIQASAVAGQTLLAQIIEQVDNAQAGKPPIQRLADRISGIFVPVVLMLALLTFGGWMIWDGNLEHALISAASVLVIACPCALGLATPAAIMTGTGLAARYGILIQDPASLETAHQLDRLAFDKTGTLTTGQPEVVHIGAAGPWSPSKILQMAASLQAGSSHPLASALRHAAEQQKLPLLAVNDSRTAAGYGVEGVLSPTAHGDTHTSSPVPDLTGEQWILGNLAYLTQQQIDIPPELKEQAQQSPYSLSWLANRTTGQVAGWIEFADRLKPDAPALIKRLRQMHIEPVMLTGDRLGSALPLAHEAGIREVYADLLPGQKAAQIALLQAGGTHVVGMVGDGINDAPALAQANLAIAMGEGTDIAMQSAGMTLTGNQLGRIADAIDLSRRTWQKIQQNLFWAFIYNLVGIPLAMTGLLNPMWAGAAMAFSSVSVLLNALLLKRWRPAQHKAVKHKRPVKNKD